MKFPKKKLNRDLEYRRPIVLPYVEGTSEMVARVMRKHHVPVAMRPVKTEKITGTPKGQTNEGRSH